MVVWSLAEAAEYAAELNAAVAPIGWHVGIAGSVLHRGWSSKDLDVQLFPLSTETAVPIWRLKEILIAFGMRLLFDEAIVKARWRRLGSLDKKHVEVWEWRGKRVDLFFLK